MGNSSLGNTLRRFIGSEPSAAYPSAIMWTRAAAMASGRRTAAHAGRSLISVTVLSNDDIYVWRLAAVDHARVDTEGYLRVESRATRSRTAFDGSFGPSSPAPKGSQNGPAKLLDICMQSSCSANGKWGDACVQVLALHAENQYHVHFLSPADLEPLRAPQRLPLLDAELAPLPGAAHLKLLPCTVTVNGRREACNLHVTDGQRVLTVRTGGYDETEDGDHMADEDWAEGPKGLVAASLHMLVDRERYTHLLVLTSEAVTLLTPTDARAHGAGDSERLPSVLKKAASARDLEDHLRKLLQKAPFGALDLHDLSSDMLPLHGLSSAIRVVAAQLSQHTEDDRGVLLCVLMDHVVRDVLDTAVDASEKERLLKHMRAKLHELLPEQHGVQA